jgi:hypothetical protein
MILITAAVRCVAENLHQRFDSTAKSCVASLRARKLKSASGKQLNNEN